MTDSINNLKFNRPPLFSPNLIRGLTEDAGQGSSFSKVIGNDMADSSIGLTSSFKYDLEGQGIKSTQQINIDFSKFENHTFFNSAQVKTNVAFDTIINKFPFDGTKQEYEVFFDKLTGFEKYVFDQYPKYKGYAFFSGSSAAEPNGGTWITVLDSEGAAYPEVSKETTGLSKLNPGFDSMTLEAWTFIPSGTNTNQFILSKISQSVSGVNGYGLYLSHSTNIGLAPATFIVLSNSFYATASFNVPKGSWKNVGIVWDRNPNVNRIYTYVDQVLTGSSDRFEFLETSWNGIPLTIGSGSTLTVPSTFTVSNTFSGALDDFRIWHTVRTAEERLDWQLKAVYADPDLKLYYKFNEPSGSNTLLTLDHSGNSLHGKLNIAGNTLGVRQIATGSIAGESPMTYEKQELTPVLFPGYTSAESLRFDLLLSASYYDDHNPNLITKLVPPHYLVEGQVEQALSTEEGSITTTIVSGSDPRSAKLGGTQALLSLMYVMAKYFDEIKLYTEVFSNLNWVDYDNTDSVPDQFLQFLASQQGFKLPPLFAGSSIEQFVDRENIQGDISTNTLSLQYIQNQIWRRILINLQDVVKSKGTIHAVKSFIRSAGIDPDNNFRIREFGGPTKGSLSFAREKRSEISTMADFVSGGFISSSYLSASRIEPGYPITAYSAPSENAWLTSGSFTYEGTYRFPKNTISHASQSLIRLMTTGSSLSGGGGLPLNVVAVSGTNRITLYTRPANQSGGDLLSLVLTGSDIFDGDKWYVSVGRQRNDNLALSSSVSSSYFIRAAKQSFGEITEAYFTQSFFDETSGSVAMQPVWGVTSTSGNASGSYLTIGSQSLGTGTSLFLNYDLEVPNQETRVTYFDGRVSQIRFWSKYLDANEWQEHVRNFKSLGVQDPTLNFNFVVSQSGSWERLRIDASTDQILTASNVTGQIQFFDFSQNNLHFSGSSFPLTYSVMKPERFYYSYISPKFDEASTTEKVRPRSFLNYQNVLSSSYAQTAPLYRLELSEQPTDNTKFSIDFSIVDALDQDIINIFSTLDALDNILGDPELMFSPDYPKLEVLRDVYFNRITSKINLKGFFEFYKWFDSNIGNFISQLIPRKTKYLGTNFVLESHMLERAKVEYQFVDQYMGDSKQSTQKNVILLQLISGEFRRY